jgi:putative transposase
MDKETKDTLNSWRTIHGDLTDDEWVIIGDFFPTYSQPGTLGRPAKWDKRDVVNAILYVLATGCQWRALPKNYPHWNTVHRYHKTWSNDGVWAAVAAHVVGLVRQAEGRDAEPSAGIVDARSVRGAATVTGPTRGYDAGKKISGRKTFGIVDSLGLLIAITVVVASTSDNAGGITVADKARKRSSRFAKMWCDSGFKTQFIRHCRDHHVSVEVVKRIHPHQFVVLPKRWIVERTWSWIMNNRRLQVDYERDPVTTEGFIWAAQTRIALRKLTETTARG